MDLDMPGMVMRVGNCDLRLGIVEWDGERVARELLPVVFDPLRPTGVIRDLVDILPL